MNAVKQYCKGDKKTCSKCVGCNPEGFYQDGELSEREALKLHGGKYIYCTNCVPNYKIERWANTVICEACHE